MGQVRGDVVVSRVDYSPLPRQCLTFFSGAFLPAFIIVTSQPSIMSALDGFCCRVGLSGILWHVLLL